MANTTTEPMTHAEAAARLAASAPKCPYCGEPGRIVRDYSEGTLCQCTNPRCGVRGSWTEPTVIETTGCALESWRAA